MKSKKIFLDPTDGGHEVASYSVDVEKYEDASYVDFDITLSDGHNKFGMWYFISEHGKYDDALNRLDVLSAFIQEAREALVDAYAEANG